MPSSELESIVTRNGNFLTVLRAGSGDGNAGLYNSVSGEYLGGIGGGALPEYSRHLNPDGTGLVRGWRNILYELLARKRVRLSKEIKRILGEHEAFKAYEYGLGAAPMSDPNPAWNHSGLHS